METARLEMPEHSPAVLTLARTAMRIGEVLAGVGAKAHVFGVGNKPMLSRLC